MSGIAPFAIFHVNRLKVDFADDIGNTKTITGTGFWIDANGTEHFVTNAHNLEPKMKLGADTKFELKRVWIQLRAQIEGGWIPWSSFFEVAEDENIKFHATADVAVIVSPQFTKDPGIYKRSAFGMADLADQKFFEAELHPMDVASFIGFPGKKGIAWYDELWELAIARSCNIASLPAIGFTNKQISTSDVMLVSGLSFSGSSGSPIINHEKGLKLGPGLTGGSYTPPKLIGIMSGHWWDELSEGDMFNHSGLSYLTRSTAIIDLIANLSTTPAASP